MDHFFNSIASLMSNLLRRVVERSLDDFVALLEQYKGGNDYDGEYLIFDGLAVSRFQQPSTLFLVCFCYCLPYSNCLFLRPESS